MPNRRIAVVRPDRCGLVALAAWMLSLMIAARSLAAVAAPHRGDISSVTWWVHTSIDRSAVTGLCLMGLGLVMWLASTTAIGVVLAMAATVSGRTATLPAWWHRLSPAVVRRIVGAVVGTGLSVAAVAPVGAAPATGTDATTTGTPPVLVLLADPATTPSEPTPPSAPPEAVIAAPGVLTWTIEPGDHLWHVASATLAWARGRPADDLEVATYLDRLIDINTDVVAVSGDADVVFAGQTFVLPPLEADDATRRSAT